MPEEKTLLRLFYLTKRSIFRNTSIFLYILWIFVLSIYIIINNLIDHTFVNKIRDMN